MLNTVIEVLSKCWSHLLNTVLIPFFRNWPTDGINALLLFTLFGIFGGTILFILFVCFISPFGKTGKDIETAPIEVPPHMAALTLRENSFFMRNYHFIWGMYPRDVCSFMPRCIVMFIWETLAMIVCVMTILSLSVFLYYLPFALWQGAWMIASWIKNIPVALPELLEELFFGVAGKIWGVVYNPITLLILMMAVLFIFLGVVCFISNLSVWKLVSLWIKAKKEKYCPLIRII